jgi:beta-N-acetylhexosaminidase
MLASMTLDEKIGQMILVYHSPQKFLKKHHIGSVVIMQTMIKEDLSLKRELAKIQKSMKIPLIACIDQEGGKINRLANLEKFKKTPSAREMAAWENKRITEYASSLTAFLNGLYINTNLAPCIDPSFNFNGDTTFMHIRHRSFGADNQVIIEKAGAFISGIKEKGGISILKHFPGYDVRNNSDDHISISEAMPEHLDTYLMPFQVLCEKADGIMMSNIIYKNIDSLPAVLSPKIVAKARALCGENVVITDDLWAVSLRSFILPGKKIHKVRYPDKKFMRIVELAVLAGNDILMITFPKKVPLIFKAVKQMVKKDGTILSSIDASVLRILKLKARLSANKN